MAAITRRPGWTGGWLPRLLFDVFEAPETVVSERPMRVEEYQHDGHLVVKADLPDVDPDKDIEITVHDGMLEIRAERRQESKTEDKKHYRSEFRYGMFARRLSLPAGASEADIDASYRNGVLEVRVPVAEVPAEAKKVPISHG